MKSIFSVIAVACIAIFSAVSCTTDPVSPNQSLTNPPTDSSWRVTWFWDKDKDETSDFTSYTFHFRANGVFEAVSNSGTVTGTWSTTSDDGTQRLVLFISPTKPLSEMNDDWVITEFNDQSIKLKDDNTEHVEELFFERKG